MMFVSIIYRSKTVGEDAFLAAKVSFSRRREKYFFFITILTMCKIYNSNNIKTAYIIYFYYYIDEII